MPDKHLAPLVQNKEAASVVASYREAQLNMEAAKAQLDEAKAKLIEIAGGQKTNVSGVLVYQVEKKGSVSYAKVVKEHCADLDLEPYRGKPNKYWVVK